MEIIICFLFFFKLNSNSIYNFILRVVCEKNDIARGMYCIYLGFTMICVFFLFVCIHAYPIFYRKSCSNRKTTGVLFFVIFGRFSRCIVLANRLIFFVVSFVIDKKPGTSLCVFCYFRYWLFVVFQLNINRTDLEFLLTTIIPHIRRGQIS